LSLAATWRKITSIWHYSVTESGRKSAILDEMETPLQTLKPRAAIIGCSGLKKGISSGVEKPNSEFITAFATTLDLRWNTCATSDLRNCHRIPRLQAGDDGLVLAGMRLLFRARTNCTKPNVPITDFLTNS
jgi:hypothetical protein